MGDFRITHEPLSVSKDGVLIFPELSHYYTSTPNIPISELAPFRHIELKALATTICEVFAAPFEQISIDNIAVFRKIITHLNKQHPENEGISAIINQRTFELSDTVLHTPTFLRVGTMTCLNCQSGRLTLVDEEIVFKDETYTQSLECACGAKGLIKDGWLVGGITNVFYQLESYYLTQLIINSIHQKLYSYEDLTLHLSCIFPDFSIFKLNPQNQRQVDKRIKLAISKFGNKSFKLNSLQYYLDRQLAISYNQSPIKRQAIPSIEEFLKESDEYEARAGLSSVLDLKNILKQIEA